MRSAIVIALLASAASAEEPVTADVFESYVTDRTLAFRSEFLAYYGTEQFLSDRRVIWSGLDEICRFGVWYEDKGDICFLYDHKPEPQCWSITIGPEGLEGTYTTRPTGTRIFEIDDDDPPLVCRNFSS